MRRTAWLLLAALTFAGCTGGPRKASDQPAPPQQEETAETPQPAPPPQPAPQAPKADGPVVLRQGSDLWIPRLSQASSVAWSPSTAVAVIQAPDGAYLLDPDQSELQELPGLISVSRVFFWSEGELAWTREIGHHQWLMLRDTATGKDRELIDFGGTANHFIQPGDARAVFCRVKGQASGEVPHPYGEIIATGPGQESSLLPEGYLVGRLADGRTLVVQGRRYGPLAAVDQSGSLTWLSRENVYFPQISPDGKRVLWFTRAGNPAPNQDELYPKADTLQIWDGGSSALSVALPKEIAIVEALFAPDGRRIAVATADLGTGAGHLSVWDGARLLPLQNHTMRMPLKGWDGNGILYFRPSQEKTGAEPAIFRTDLDGKETIVPYRNKWGAYIAVSLDGKQFLHADVIWPDSAERRRVDREPVQVLSSRPDDPYLASVEPDGLWLLKLDPAK
jgi:hypothetical protein